MNPLHYTMRSREFFFVLPDLSTWIDRYRRRMQPMTDAQSAKLIANVNAFYRADLDLALICLTCDAGNVDGLLLAHLVDLGTEAGLSVIDPERFSDVDREYFYQDYLRRFAIVATNMRSSVGALEATARQLGLYEGAMRRERGRSIASDPDRQQADVRMSRLASVAEQNLPDTTEMPQRIESDNLHSSRDPWDEESNREFRGRFDSESGGESSVVTTPASDFDPKPPTRAGSPRLNTTKGVDAQEYRAISREGLRPPDLGPAGVGLSPVELGPAGNERARGKNKQRHRLPTVPATPAAIPQRLGSDLECAPQNNDASDGPTAFPSRRRPPRSTASQIAPAGDQELVRLRFQRGDIWMPGRLRSLTTTDIRLAASAAPPEGSILRISVRINDLHALVTGIVVNVINTEGSADGSTTFGCKFRGVDKHQHEQLVALLRMARERGLSLAAPPARRARRFAINWPVAIQQKRSRFNAWALDISEQGFFLSTKKQLRSDQLLFGLPLEKPGLSVRGHAKIARKVSEHMARERGLSLGYGLQIEGFEVRDHKPFADFLARVRNRSQRHVVVAGEGARTTALADSLRSAGYAVSTAASVETVAHHTQFESAAPDVAMMDSDSLSANARRDFLVLYGEHNVPLLLANDYSPNVVREKLDRMVQI